MFKFDVHLRWMMMIMMVADEMTVVRMWQHFNGDYEMGGLVWSAGDWKDFFGNCDDFEIATWDWCDRFDWILRTTNLYRCTNIYYLFFGFFWAIVFFFFAFSSLLAKFWPMRISIDHLGSLIFNSSMLTTLFDFKFFSNLNSLQLCEIILSISRSSCCLLQKFSFLCRNVAMCALFRLVLHCFFVFILACLYYFNVYFIFDLLMLCILLIHCLKL